MAVILNPRIFAKIEELQFACTSLAVQDRMISLKIKDGYFFANIEKLKIAGLNPLTV